ncbi:hypothetical protein [Mycobacteroides abscessus]|uniref:hypothetical protein n=1 Tax=Mycobacteroides abscessus TaxID=36809 RepID=UPI0010421A44|nr:hypothetical protein [Mycobacteroides abscessus]
MAKKPAAATMTAEDRQRLLDDLAQQQAQQRAEQVSALSNLYTEIARLRAQLAKAETTYRATYRSAIGAGLLTAAQLRTLGLPALPAAKTAAIRSTKQTKQHSPMDRVPAHKTRNTHPDDELPERPQ